MHHVQRTAYYAAAIGLALAPQARAASWGPPSAVLPGSAIAALPGSIALDDSGNTAVSWMYETPSPNYHWLAYVNNRAAGGAFQPAVNLPTTPVAGGYIASAIVRTSAAGLMTTVWRDNTAVWAADKPPGGTWGLAQPIGPGLSFPSIDSPLGTAFTMDAAGNAVVVVGTPTTGHPYGATTLLAITRPAGGQWRAPATIVSGNNLNSGSPAIGHGAIYLSWENWQVIRHGYNFTQHVSVSTDFGQTWSDSGTLLGPDAIAHFGQIAADAQGRAGLVARGGAGPLVALTTPGPNQPFSAPVAITPSAGWLPGSRLVADDAGNLTLLASNSVQNLYALQGSTAGGAWTVTPLATTPNLGGLDRAVLAVAHDGTLAAAYGLGFQAPLGVQVRMRAPGATSWQPPVTLTTTRGQPFDIVFNGNDQASLAWTTTAGIVVDDER